VTVHYSCVFNQYPAMPLPTFDSSPAHLLRPLAISLGLHVLLILSVASELPVRLEMPRGALQVVVSNGRAIQSDSASTSKVLAMPDKGRHIALSNVGSGQFVVEQVFSVPTVAAHSAQSPSPASVLDSPSALAVVNGATSTSAISRDGVNGDDLRQYRLSLAIAARGFKHYPALARERGWEGSVELAVSVSSLQSAPQVVLVRSSGLAMLDEQAAEMVAQAVRLTALPESLIGKNVWVPLPISFSLAGD
jgi:periplasmic protein TonB